MAITLNFKAEERKTVGTGSARAARLAGNIPAVIYAKDKTLKHISVNARELSLAINRGKFFSKVIEFDINGTKVKTIPQDVQIHPVKDTPIHADFIKVDEKSEFKVTVPVEFVNIDKAPGLKRGGILNTVRRTVEVWCTIAHIPEKLIADLTGLQIGDNVKYSKLEGTSQVHPVITGRDFTIATIAGRLSEEEELAREQAGSEALQKAAAEKAAADAAATAAAKEGKTPSAKDGKK
ncbi:MAG TPA: 50S ribosomal protein L25 [Alphaproteobacteria bacterium]|nr:50S ribosomal protein L25 [Alphaproteobacteria bacterium]